MGAATATETRTVDSVVTRLFWSQVAASVPLNTLARFSNVKPVAVLLAPGVKARTTVTMMGTRTITVMARIRANLHQRPRIPASESTRRVFPESVIPRAGPDSGWA